MANRAGQCSLQEVLLVGDNSRPSSKSPIFLRFCHSPWLLSSRRALSILQAVIASFLSIVVLAIVHETKYTQRGKQFVFEASNSSLMIQILYYRTTMVGVLPLQLISQAVLDLATYLGTLWSR